MTRLTILGPNGQKISLSVRDGDGLAAVKRKLFEEGNSVIAEETVKGVFRTKRLSTDEMLVVTKIFETITSSSIPIVKGILIEMKETRAPRLRDFFASVKYLLESGQSLSGALEGSGYFFSSLYLGMVSAGEKSGKLGEIFSLLSGYLKKSSQVRRELVNASIYPLIVALTAISVFVFIVSFVMPQLSELYAAFGKKLPTATLVVMWLSGYFKKYFFVLVLIFVAGIGGLLLGTRSSVLVGRVTEVFVKVPILNTWISDFFLSRFLKVLSIQLSGGESLTKALESLGSLFVSNKYFERYISKIEKEVREGKALSKAMESEMPVERAIIYVEHGEESGKTSAYLGEASEYYDERVSQRLVVLKEIVQPLLILFVGALTGLILVTLFLPVFMSSSLLRP